MALGNLCYDDGHDCGRFDNCQCQCQLIQKQLYISDDVCSYPNLLLVANGQCDHVTNTKQCGFDGGDCCGHATEGNVDKTFCLDCECKHGEDFCPFTYKIGDKMCDKANNIPQCDYDGGDCADFDEEDGFFLG